MKKSELSAVQGLSGSQAAISNVSIIEYNSDKATINSRLKLRQNLFSFLLEGQKSVQYAEAKVTISPSQFLLLSSGNCLMTEKTAAAGGRYRSILFLFDNKVLADFFIRHPRPLLASIPKNKEVPYLVFDKDAFLINFIESLGFMLAYGQPLSDEMQKVKLEELLLYLSEHYPETIQLLRSASYQADADLIVRQAITANVYNAVTVEELAFLCHMSLSTFKRRFHRIYDTSPNKWLLEKRMQKAAQMLKQGECRASDIYVELGYENLSSFIQSFKQIHGITPKQYKLLN
jgi:AraC-like DNA-binding protein